MKFTLSTLLFIPLLFLSSCVISGQDSKYTSRTEEKTIISQETTMDFESGFTFQQTIEQSSLLYKGKILQIWTHSNPGFYPWCNEFEQKQRELNEKRNPMIGAILVPQTINWWNELSLDKKKQCTKEYLGNKTIKLESIGTRFYKIISPSININNTISIFDTKSENIQEVTSKIKEITANPDNILITTEGAISTDLDIVLTYDSNFSKLLTSGEKSGKERDKRILLKYLQEKIPELNIKYNLYTENINLVSTIKDNNQDYFVYSGTFYRICESSGCTQPKFFTILGNDQIIYFDEDTENFKCNDINKLPSGNVYKFITKTFCNKK